LHSQFLQLLIHIMYTNNSHS